jgi:hypothetical protein
VGDFPHKLIKQMGKKLYVEKNGTQIPIASLEVVSARDQLVIGDYQNDLILRTAGKVQVQIGNKFYPISFDSNGAVTGTSVTVIDNIEDYSTTGVPNGTIVYSKNNTTVYIVVDGELVAVSGSSSTVILDLSLFENLTGVQRKQLQVNFGNILNTFTDLPFHNRSDYYANEVLYIADEQQHFALAPNTDPYNRDNWKPLYLSLIKGGKVQAPVSIEYNDTIPPGYSLVVGNNLRTEASLVTTKGLLTTDYSRGGVSAGVGITKDLNKKWTVESDKYTFRDYISTPAFVDGFSGYGIKIGGEDYSMTVDNLTVRKQLKVYELVINQIRATNGSLWVSDAARAFFVEPLDGAYKVYIDTNDSTIVQPFRVNDIVRCQKWTGKEIKYYSTRVIDIDNGGEWFTLSYLDADIEGDGIPAVNDDIVRIGNTTDTNRQGAVYITASDNAAPYIDVIDGVNTPSFYDKVRVRLGKLTGIIDPIYGQLEGYGLYTDNGYFRGKITVIGTGSNVPTNGDLTDAINNIKIGTRNYFKRTTPLEGLSFTNTPRHVINEAGYDGLPLTNGIYSIGPNSGRGTLRIINVITENGDWTVSGYVKCNGAGPSFYPYVDICDQGPQVIQYDNVNQYQYFEFTVNVTNWSAETYNFVDFSNIGYVYFQLQDLKIEKGNKATEWTLAPEDAKAENDKRDEDFRLLTEKLMTIGFDEIYNLALAGNTIIQGGYIRTTLLDALAIRSNIINAGYINTLALDAKVITSGLINSDRINASEIVIRGGGLNRDYIDAKTFASGKMLYVDPEFKDGYNGIYVYNNNGDGSVTLTRSTNGAAELNQGIPNGTNTYIAIHSSTSAAPGLGGFSFQTPSRSNAIFITVIRALIPVGYDINFASNAIGNDAVIKWGSSQAGTGKWEDYLCVVRCGAVGPFDSTNYYYLSGPTSINWYLASATVYDMTAASPNALAYVDSQVAAASLSILADASEDARIKAKQAKDDAIAAAGTDAQTKATKAYDDAKLAADTAYNNLTNKLKDTAYQDIEQWAIGGETLIQGGYIRTNLLNAEAIKTNIINAGYIQTIDLDATKITVGTLNVNRLNITDIGSRLVIDSVFTDNLVAKNIKTAETGQRIEIIGANNNQIFYDASGAEVFRLDAAIDSGSAGNPLGGIRMRTPNGDASYGTGNGFFSNGSGIAILPLVSGITTNTSMMGILRYRNQDNNGISAAIAGYDQTPAKAYNNSTTYAMGALVSYNGNNYRYVGLTPASGFPPPDANFWVTAQGISNSYAGYFIGKVKITGDIEVSNGQIGINTTQDIRVGGDQFRRMTWQNGVLVSIS